MPDGTKKLIREKIANWLRDEAGLPADAFDDDSPLSKLGIDSLGLAAISCDLERATGKRLNLEVLYELQTVNQLAESAVVGLENQGRAMFLKQTSVGGLNDLGVPLFHRKPSDIRLARGNCRAYCIITNTVERGVP